MKVIASNDFGPTGFRWLRLKRLTWTGPDGRQRFWESCERTTTPSSGVDGVAIVARLTSKSHHPQIIIERQYRPPLHNMCLELPAGLIDEGEDVGTAAARELHEETGYRGTVVMVSPVCYCDPGITNANMQVAIIDVDIDSPDNANVQQNLHEGEFIIVELAPWYGLFNWLMHRKVELGCEIDARLLSFALGLEQASAFAALGLSSSSASVFQGSSKPGVSNEPMNTTTAPINVVNGPEESSGAVGGGGGGGKFPIGFDWPIGGGESQSHPTGGLGHPPTSSTASLIASTPSMASLASEVLPFGSPVVASEGIPESELSRSSTSQSSWSNSRPPAPLNSAAGPSRLVQGLGKEQSFSDSNTHRGQEEGEASKGSQRYTQESDHAELNVSESQGVGGVLGALGGAVADALGLMGDGKFVAGAVTAAAVAAVMVRFKKA